MNALYVILSATLLATLSASAKDDIRTWTSTSGTSIEASLESVKGRRVTLKKADGKTVTLSEYKLSKEDRAFLTERSKAEAEAEAAVAAETKLKSQGLVPGEQKVRHVPASLKSSPCIATDYLLYLPKNYKPNGKKWPMVLYLHGMGSRGSDSSILLRNGLTRRAQKTDYPFIIIAPQCKKESWWVPNEIIKLVDDQADTLNVDKDRIYITGLSMGGYGTWATIAKHADIFAAAIPICGGGNPRSVKNMKDLPIWVFHGDADEVVKIKMSQVMVDALKAINGNVNFTIYPGVKHNSWSQTYGNQDVWNWMLEQKR